MVRRQTRAQKRNRRQQNKSRRNNRRQNRSLRRKRQSRRKLRGGSQYQDTRYRTPYAPDHFRETAKDREIRERREQEEREKYKADEETAKGYGMTAEEYRAMFAW